MPKQQVLDLCPTGWETDPVEERFKVSTLDYLTACTYNNYVVFFRLDEADKTRAVDILRAGLERTLSQARHMCGTIEKDDGGGHSFVKKKDSHVRFVVQWLDSPEYPSFDDIENAHFGAPVLGDLDLWSVEGMKYGEGSRADPNSSPVVSAFKVNLVRGGLLFHMHQHHYANDVMGWAGFTRQLAENCFALVHKAPFPPWDPACLDLSRFTRPEVPDEAKIDGPPRPERHPDHMPVVSLLFHLPKSKAAELKKLATPTDGTWISTYDAFSAFILRTLTRLRASVFQPVMTSPILWGEGVDMRRRLLPHIPERLQRNVMSATVSDAAPFPPPTIEDVISRWSLPQLASYIRRLTDSVTPDSLDRLLDMVSAVRDRTALNIRASSKPPMSVLQTDHRDAAVSTLDFGFATPVTYRHVADCVTENLVLVYPPRRSGSDEGCEFALAYERDLARELIWDPEWKWYFEYRGVDAVNAGDDVPEYGNVFK